MEAEGGMKIQGILVSDRCHLIAFFVVLPIRER